LWDAHPGHEAPVPPHPKDPLLGWDLVTVGAILVQWIQIWEIVIFVLIIL